MLHYRKFGGPSPSCSTGTCPPTPTSTTARPRGRGRGRALSLWGNPPRSWSCPRAWRISGEPWPAILLIFFMKLLKFISALRTKLYCWWNWWKIFTIVWISWKTGVWKLLIFDSVTNRGKNLHIIVHVIIYTVMFQWQFYIVLLFRNIRHINGVMYKQSHFAKTRITFCESSLLFDVWFMVQIY